jgi:amino acid transporter
MGGRSGRLPPPAVPCRFAAHGQVSTAAEEVKNPGRDLPIGIVGSLSVASVFYMLMCLVITGMVPYDQIDRDAPFSVAFTSVSVHVGGCMRAHDGWLSTALPSACAAQTPCSMLCLTCPSARGVAGDEIDTLV